jgi:iron-sulfur cluster repair protein YtfE (RIC family)
MAELRSLADALGSLPPLEAKVRLEEVRSFLVERLVPHEEHEDREVFPMLAQAARSDDMTSALHRTHTEIFHLIRLADRLVADIPEEGPAPEDLNDLRRVLYGLDAILRLHMAQEEELYMALGDEHPAATAPAAAAAA